MSSWGLLDEKEELELHKTRLLNVEEKPFKRVTKHLHALHWLTVNRARQETTPPPESNGVNGTANEDEQPATPTPDASSDIQQLKDTITLDFAAFNSNLERLQQLLTANEQQRDRYVKEKARIEQQCTDVRAGNADLRLALEQARATLEQRKKFDELADNITRNPTLRQSRAEQAAGIRKLEEEITQLQAESETYAATWRERRDQFSRIMDESMRLRRQIRDEKEEVERREGMDDGENTPAPTAEGSQTPSRAGIASGNATPRPESGVASKGAQQENSDSRPVSTLGGRTPARDSPAPGNDSQSLRPRPSNLGGLSPGYGRAGSQMGGSRAGSQPPSRGVSPEPSKAGSRAASKSRSRRGSQSSSRGASPVRIAPSVQGDDDGKMKHEGEDVEMADTQANEIKKRSSEEEMKVDDGPNEGDSPLSSVPDESQEHPQIAVGNEGEGGDRMDTT